MAGAYLIAFSEPSKVSIVALTPALFAFGAAALWGMGTVLGRSLGRKLTFGTLTALRFAIGLPAAGLLVLFVPDANAVSSVTGSDLRAIVALALVPGLLALLSYYRGLRFTPASMATLAELAFPLTATTLNYFVFGTTLTPTQWVGVALLAGTITMMSLVSQRGREAVGVRLAPAVSEA
jgi:drug/metabolite transporter (DMT)-like permease